MNLKQVTKLAQTVLAVTTRDREGGFTVTALKGDTRIIVNVNVRLCAHRYIAKYDIRVNDIPCVYNDEVKDWHRDEFAILDHMAFQEEQRQKVEDREVLNELLEMFNLS